MCHRHRHLEVAISGMPVTYCGTAWQVPIPRYDKAAQSGKGDRAPQASRRQSSEACRA